MFFSLLLSLSHGRWARGVPPLMALHVCASVCLCLGVHSWFEEDVSGLVFYRIKGLE